MKMAANPAAKTARAMRSGADYLAAIKEDGRHVYFDGDVVKDVTAHPAFKGAARSLARLFDVAADPANAAVMTFPSPKTGAPVWRCYEVPKPPPTSARGGR
jgi:4-hydroxyphenylacetate 3-monooxygenase